MAGFRKFRKFAAAAVLALLLPAIAVQIALAADPELLGYAALLDELKIDRVIVEGASGGAPSAVQFALCHPQRTKALILIVPLFEGWNGTGNEVPPPGLF